MYAIEYFVGAKYGGWLRGDDRFASADQALWRVERDRHDEHKATAAKFIRRVVKVAG